MVGPNCMGVLNADPAVSMNGTFAPSLPPFGKVGFVSQSGAMGLSVLDYAREYGIGISQFVSMGNKPDVSGNDLLLAWEDDPDVEVDPHVRRELREPGQVPADRLAHHQAEADHRGQVGALAGRRPGGVLPHRRARGERRRGGRPAGAGRRAAGRHASRSCSISRWGSRSSGRPRPAAPWCSPTPADRGSSPPTPARRTGSSSPISRPRPWRGWRRSFPPKRRSATRST